MLPSNMLILVEEAWNCYPYCKTVLTNGYLDKEKFKIDIESMHLPDAGTTDNALAMSPAELKDRKVEKLDIRTAYAGCEPKDYKPQCVSYTVSLVPQHGHALAHQVSTTVLFNPGVWECA